MTNRQMTPRQKSLLQEAADHPMELHLSFGNRLDFWKDVETASALFRRGYLVLVSETTADRDAGTQESRSYIITPEGRNALVPKKPGQPRKWTDSAERAAARRQDQEQIYFWARQVAGVIGGYRGLHNEGATWRALEQMVKDHNRRGEH